MQSGALFELSPHKMAQAPAGAILAVQTVIVDHLLRPAGNAGQ